MRGANFAGANLQGAIFATVPAEKSAKIQKTDSFIIKSPPALGIGLWQGVNFNQVQNLDRKQISYLCTQEVLREQCDESATLKSWSMVCPSICVNLNHVRS